MKKILSLILVLCLALAMIACGAAGEGGAAAGETGGGEASGGVFMAGFGMQDITPKDPVPLDSYGDAKDRISEGLYSKLEARAVVLKDAEGGMLAGVLLLWAMLSVTTCPRNWIFPRKILSFPAPTPMLLLLPA